MNKGVFCVPGVRDTTAFALGFSGSATSAPTELSSNSVVIPHAFVPLA